MVNKVCDEYCTICLLWQTKEVPNLRETQLPSHSPLSLPLSFLSYLRAGDTYEVSEHENYLPYEKKKMYL